MHRGGGGYKDMETARRACDQIKKLGMPRPDKVKLYTMPTFDKKGQYQSDELVNPFKSAPSRRSPGKAAANAGGWSTEDLAEMKALNADEPYNLLKNPKTYTLAVKQYALNMQLVTAGSGTSMFGKVAASQSTSKEDADAARLKSWRNCCARSTRWRPTCSTRNIAAT